jgi:hypothetical protein
MGLCFNYQFIWVTEFAIDVAQSVEYLSSQRFCKLSFFVLNFPFMHAIGVIIALQFLYSVYNNIIPFHRSLLISLLSSVFFAPRPAGRPRETSSTWMSLGLNVRYSYSILDYNNACYTYSNFTP